MSYQPRGNDAWRRELEAHDRYADAHSEARRATQVHVELEQQAALSEVWKAVEAVRRDVAQNTRWRWLLAGGLTVVGFEVTVIGAVLAVVTLH